MVAGEEVVISEAEAALYDRQIRLWGLEAQKRLRGARVLLIGMGGLGAEVAKNITLAGIKSLTILDDRNAAAGSANFLVSPDAVGQNVAEASLVRLQRLNPMVEVAANKSELSTLEEDFFTGFDVVCATRAPVEESIRINNICRKNSIPFYSGDVFGFSGYFFVDLLEHEYAEDVITPVAVKGDSPSKLSKSTQTETKTVKNVVNYVPLQTAFEANASLLNKRSWNRIKSHFVAMKTLLIFRTQMKRDPEMASQQTDLEKLYEIRDHVQHEMKLDDQIVGNDTFQFVFGELSPAAAVLGGVLAQEIIKAVSHKDVPIRNHFFFNGASDRAGVVEAIGF